MYKPSEQPTGGGPSAAKQIRFASVLLPNFTLTAFSGFVDLLRLASDGGDFSKPVRCAWSIVGETLTPVRASCGIQVAPWTTYREAGEFDYIVVVGGLLDAGPPATVATLQFIRRAPRTQLPRSSESVQVFLRWHVLASCKGTVSA